MASLSETYADAGSSPLPDDAPDPAWVRDDSPEFERINAEIAKFESLSKEAAPDWSNLIRTTGDIVKNKSKDLLAVSYLCRGLFEREGYRGLAAGLQILGDIVDQFWELAYPPARRKKRRGNEIEWLIDRLNHPVAQRRPTKSDREAVYQATDLVLGLEEKLRAQLDDHAPIFRELRDTLTGYRTELAAEEEKEKKAEEARQAQAAAPSPVSPEPEPAPAPQSTTAPEAPPVQRPAQEERPVAAASAVAAPDVVGVASEADVRKAITAVRRALQQLGAFWRSQKLSDPRPYVILRFGAWMQFSGPPQVELPGPTKNQVSECRRLLEAGSHRELIEYVEGIFANPDAPPNCHWLDSHRYTATALEALGSEYDRAREGVLQALRYYLANFPGTMGLKFTTDVEYADAQTKAWIQAEVLSAPSGMQSKEAPGTRASEPDDSLRRIVDETRALAAKGKNQEAVGLLQGRLAAAGSGREAFALGLEQARFCAELGYSEVAASVLEGLREKTDYHHLDQWEPDLSVETIKLLLKMLPKCGNVEPARLAELRSRLARLDAVAVMEVMQKP